MHLLHTLFLVPGKVAGIRYPLHTQFIAQWVSVWTTTGKAVLIHATHNWATCMMMTLLATRNL